MEKKLTADLNVVANSNLEIEYLNGDLNIIQKLDDEPNDVGGLTSAQLKAKFDEAGNTIKTYINDTLIPAILADDATEAARKAAEQERVTAEQGRVSAEEARVAAETARDSAETVRQSAETARSGAESTRQSKEAARQAAETARANAETERQAAENSRVEAESQRAAAEQARADENTGIVAQATAQAAAAAGSAQTAESWAVGGTGTRPGEDTNNAKYWAEQAQATVGGDFATKTEAQGYVADHNQSATAHSDIREAVSEAGKAFVITGTLASDELGEYTVSGVTVTEAEIQAAIAAGEAVVAKLTEGGNIYELPLVYHAQSKYQFGVNLGGLGLFFAISYTESGIESMFSEFYSASNDSLAGLSENVDNQSQILLTHVNDTIIHVTTEEKTGWNAKAAGKHASQHGTNGSDPITPSAIGAIATTAKGTAGGVASLDTTGKVPSSQLPEISSVKTYTATIGTTWTEDSTTGVKTQSVAIPGVLSTHTATVDHAYTGGGTSLSYAAFVEAENQYLNCITNGYAETYNGGIKFTIFGDANTVSIPIVVVVM